MIVYTGFSGQDLLGKSQKHLKSVNETYRQHMVKALGYAFTLQRLVPVLIIHSLIPALFTCTASNAMKGILEDRCCCDEDDKQLEFDFEEEWREKGIYR
jgi:hypothetical protein